MATFANDLMTWHMDKICRSPVLKNVTDEMDVSVAILSNEYVVCEYSSTRSSLLSNRVKRNLCEIIRFRVRGRTRGRLDIAKVTDRLVFIQCPSS